MSVKNVGLRVKKWRMKTRLWLLQHLPAGLLYHPFEWLIGYMCLVAAPFAIAGAVRSDSVERFLPEPVYVAWGVVLLVGALGMISGLASIRRTSTGYVVTRLPSYRLGLRLLAIGSLVYAVAILDAAGTGGVLSIIYLLPFAAACGIRLLMLGGRREL